MVLKQVLPSSKLRRFEDKYVLRYDFSKTHVDLTLSVE